MTKQTGLWGMFRRLAGEETIDRAAFEHAEAIGDIAMNYGIRILEATPDRGARPWRKVELHLINETLALLGPAFYSPFLAHPLDLWIDRTPGGGGYGSGTLRIGDPGHDPSLLYRVFLHEGTHASNEYRGWPYERQYCMRPGFDWRREGKTWVHPRQQGRAAEAGTWETLPVDSRDVSVAPGEDLAETVRYFVHSVRDERAYLWPLDQTKPATYLWDTSPTRFIFVRDIFLALPPTHIWYRTLDPEVEARVAQVLRTA
ncbi:MAG TPA: hypothetical protein PKD09_00225 [Aggregatilinea sp.]|jgi:hypothetical protein|uniref:hypothetical protein n=1 Tax=Aggregatilinea sp. TaxID=2806333 RepID=UPI002CC0CD06|nr:hypothetical protein [Aggregatilinea sp.]HML20040.1 hypothetical protein [Aggregatilinea sp.]